MAERTTNSERPGVRVGWLAAAALALGILLLGVGAAARANASGMEITTFITHTSTDQAGGHPDVDYTITWSNRLGVFDPCNCEDARVLDTHFPTGFIGDPHAVPQCSLAEFSLHRCSPDSQVGVLDVTFFRQAIYNMEPHTGEPGLTGFTVPVIGTPAFVVLHARTDSDYGLDATTSPIFHFAPINVLEVHLWGVPAAAKNDSLRFPAETTGGGVCGPYPTGCFAPLAATVPPRPFLQNPTTCGVPLTASQDVLFYEGAIARAESAWPATTGCDQLSFDPSITAVPTTSAADTASGLDVELKVPQPQSPTAPSPSEIRSVSLTLPKGFSLVPNGANGKTACADSELRFETELEAQCPEFAKIGTASIDSSALPAPISGNVYIGQPTPGQLYRLFVTADGFATHVKLKGTADLDPVTGQIVTKFIDLPQSPIQRVDLHFFGSERGIFGTPTKCGSYPVEAEFVPWDEALPTQTSTSFFPVESGPEGKPCPDSPRPFEPQVRVGSSDHTAGAFTPFALELDRADGDQNLTGLRVTAPPGFLASLRGVAYCPETAIARLADAGYKGRSELDYAICPSSSRVGSVTAGAGPGTRPVYVRGNVYLAGPYKGSPLSLVVAIPAVSGPFDLGNVPVRLAVDFNPVTAQVSAVSDPLPQILEGVPLRTRYIQVRLDRPDFTLNPTNCDPFAVRTVVTGDEGGVANLSSPYQVANCADLEFEPDVSIRLVGGVRRRGHPAIHAVLRAAPGEANLSRISVTLPAGEQLDNAHIATVCTRVDYAKEACPSGSRIGRASVETPLLDQPLTGDVYLRSSTHRLPDLVLDLKGQIDIDLVARVDSVDGRLRTTFEGVPDAPVSTVTLDLAGGAKGLLINSETLCGNAKQATVQMDGQNGARRSARPKLDVVCGSAPGKRKRHGKRGRG